MSKKEITLLAEKFIKLKQQEDLIKKEKSELSEKLIKALKANNDIETKMGKVSLTESIHFKYLDEEAILKLLRKHKFTNFTNQKVDTKKLNTELKKQGVLAEILEPYFLKVLVDKINVKEG